MSWIVWAFVLLAQNASFTWVSRARNSSSIAYHAVASVFSNGTWFIGLMFATDKLLDAKQSGDWTLFVVTASFYTVFTVTGSITMHHLLMRYIETGKRKVGAA